MRSERVSAWRGPAPGRPDVAAAARAHAAPARRAPAQALALGRRVRARRDGVRDARVDRRRAGRLVGGVGRRATARAHAPPPGPGADGARARARRRARAALRGERGRRGRLAARRAVHLDPQAGRHPRARHGARPAVRGLRRASTTPPATTPATPPGAGRSASASPSRARASPGTWSRASTTASPRSAPSGSTARRTTSSRCAFADDLSAVGDLRCEPVAVRAHRERLLLLASEYEMPFGRFSGTLPHAGALREGWGVMERHRVRW